MPAVTRLVAFACLLLVVAARGGELPEELRAEIDRRVEAFREKSGAPGVSVAAGVDNHLAYERGYGLADLENEVPATPRTVYRLASISKMLTAVAVLQLVESGKLDLAAPIQTYVPGFPEKQAPITCDLLLKHQSGIRHYKLGEVDSAKSYARVRDAFGLFQDDPLLFNPGQRFSYTTYGYNVLGAAVEGASGEEYTAYVLEHIAEPCGMTSLRPDRPAEIIPHRAGGYRRVGKKKLANDFQVDVSNKIPGGGWCSTAGDLIRFAGALAGEKLLNRSTLEQMWTPQPTATGDETDAGYGCFIEKVDDDRLIYHSGGQPKVSTFLVFSPEKKVAVAVMCNLREASPRALALEVLELVSAESLAATAAE